MHPSTAVRRPWRSFRALAFAMGLVALYLTSLGCAQVSPQSAILADTVGQRLLSLQTSHEALVRQSFDHSRQRVERFLTERWIPQFLERLTADADGRGRDLVTVVEEASPFDDAQTARLDEAFRSHGITDTAAARGATIEALGGSARGETVLAFARAALDEIETKRRALLDPIDDLETRALSELRASYGQILAAQNAVSAHLHSLVEVQAAQDQVLDRFHLLEKRDRVVERALAINQGVGDLLDGVEDVEEAFSSLEQSLHTAASAPDQPSDP